MNLDSINSSNKQCHDYYGNPLERAFDSVTDCFNSSCRQLNAAESWLVDRYPRLIVFRILGRACLKTYRENGALSLMVTAGKVTLLAGFTIGSLAFIIGYLCYGILDCYQSIGKIYNINHYLEHVFLYTEYNVPYTTLDSLQDIFIYVFGAGLFASVPLSIAYAGIEFTSGDPFFRHLKTVKRECYSTDSTS